jgi:hypothetical protein
MILNLMIGIAVGEIKEVVDEADMRSIAMKIKFSLRIQAFLFGLYENYERPMLYINNNVKSNSDHQIMKSNYFKIFRFRKSNSKMKENETNEMIIKQLNLMQNKFEDFKTSIESKLNSLNFDISELRLDTNLIKAELINRNSY